MSNLSDDQTLFIDAHHSAFGPLLLGPLSEIFGRSRVLQLANLWYAGEYNLSPRRDLLIITQRSLEFRLWIRSESQPTHCISPDGWIGW